MATPRNDILLFLFNNLQVEFNQKSCFTIDFIFFQTNWKQFFIYRFCPDLPIKNLNIFHIEKCNFEEYSVAPLILVGYSTISLIDVSGSFGKIPIYFKQSKSINIAKCEIAGLDASITIATNVIISNSNFRKSHIMITRSNNVEVSNSSFTDLTYGEGSLLADFGDKFIMTNVYANRLTSFLSVSSFMSAHLSNITVENVDSSNLYDLTNAVTLEHIFDLSIVDSHFRNNYGINGSHIFISGAFDLRIDSSTFSNGRSKYFGGSIFIEDFSKTYVESMGTITNCKFFNNSAERGYGGALYSDYSFGFLIDSCEFIDNNAFGSGGAVSFNLFLRNLAITNSKFINNHAFHLFDDKDFGGGAISILPNLVDQQGKIGKREILNSYFEKNSSPRGGAFFITNGNVSVIGNTLLNNQAAISGGVGFMVGTFEKINMVNNVMEGNLAKKIGFGGYSNELGYSIQSLQVSNNESLVFIPSSALVIDIEGYDINGKRVAADFELLFVSTPNEDVTCKVNNRTNSSLIIICYYMTNNNSGIENLPFSLLIHAPMSSKFIELPLTLAKCPPKTKLGLVPSDANEFLYGCVNIPEDQLYLVLGVAIPVAFLAFICGMIITVLLIRITKSIISKLRLLKDKERAENELERKINDKNLIFDLIDDDSERNTSKKKVLNNNELYFPLLETPQTPSFLIPIEDIDIERKIGEGGNGIVYLGNWRSLKVAIKSIKGLEISENVDEFDKEAAILSRLRHLNIVQFYGVSVTKSSKYMITEFLTRGSLEKVIYECKIKSSRISLETKLSILYDIANGMDYLHNMKPAIIHRDLKPGNILLNDSFQAKVCDFGLVRLVGNSMQTALTMNIGTIMYIAPECIEDITNYGDEKKSTMNVATKIDVYAFSIIMWELLFELIPFVESPSSTQKRNVPTIKIPWMVQKGERPILLETEEEISNWTTRNILESYSNVKGIISDYQQLMKVCWAVSPFERPSFKDILDKISEMRRNL